MFPNSKKKRWVGSSISSHGHRENSKIRKILAEGVILKRSLLHYKIILHTGFSSKLSLLFLSPFCISLWEIFYFPAFLAGSKEGKSVFHYVGVELWKSITEAQRNKRDRKWEIQNEHDTEKITDSGEESNLTGHLQALTTPGQCTEIFSVSAVRNKGRFCFVEQFWGFANPLLCLSYKTYYYLA